MIYICDHTQVHTSSNFTEAVHQEKWKKMFFLIKCEVTITSYFSIIKTIFSLKVSSLRDNYGDIPDKTCMTLFNHSFVLVFYLYLSVSLETEVVSCSSSKCLLTVFAISTFSCHIMIIHDYSMLNIQLKMLVA